MNEARKIEWTASTGQKIAITLTAQYGLNLQGIRKTTGRIAIDLDATVDGKSLGGGVRIEKISHPALAAKVAGGKVGVGLTQENFDRYNAAMSELQALVAVANANIEANAVKLDAIEASRIAIEKTA
jgi:hypothetical protein